ncbi:transcription factor GAGA-like [Anopheles bellator]|uniref:transcription factor GAGA-like n=1 Tax=Anopheles bellator TaxID=139047 RepID=UPI002648087A|nr:transcription factor GAGA-like [Anopheles bellator]
MPSKECTLKTPKVGVGVINDLRNNEELIDVTLRCEGGRIGAHKILLAANSPYFRAVFQENPAQHPVIIFKNVQYSDLMAIVEFIYQGETTINSDQLQSVLSTAKMLSISGLKDDWNNSGHKSQQTDAHGSVTQQLLQPPGQKTATTAPNSQSSNMAPNSTTVHELLQTQIPTTSKTPKVRKMLHVKFAPDIQQQVHQPQEPVEQLQHKKQEEHEQVIAMQKDIISDQAGSSTNNKSFVRGPCHKIHEGGNFGGMANGMEEVE